MKKIIGFGLLGIITAIAIGAYMLASNLDGLVKAAVEGYGSDVTGTKVRLAGVEISPASGEGTLSGFVMGNPSGFKTDHAVAFDSVRVKVNFAGSSPQKVIINEIAINKPNVTYEMGAAGSNIDAIQKNVERFMGAGGSSSGGGDGPKVIIDDLYIRGGIINVSAAFLQGQALSTPLPDIHLEDIGKDSGGASPAEVAEQIVSEITKYVGVGVSSLNLDDLMSGATKVLEGTVGAAEETVKTLGGAVQGGAEGAGNLVKEGAEGVGNVLKEGPESVGGALKGLLGQ